MPRANTSLVALALLATTGCATWQNATGNPVGALATGPTTVRLTPSGATAPILLRDPAIEGDSLVGWVHSESGTRRVATDLAGIQRLDVPAPAWAQAGAAGVVVGAVALFVTFGFLSAVGPEGT